MNKFGIVLGVAAAVTLVGCKDPDYKRSYGPSLQDEVKNVDTVPVETAKPVVVEPEVKKCLCPPGTKHTSPCTCGAPDCKCIVEVKPVITVDLSKKPVEPETTTYIVRNGDYLSKISQKYNVTIASIKRLNPSIKSDNVIRVGQKIKLPGKIDVGDQSVPKAVVAPAASGKAPAAAYTGATKEYVVKNGDMLGSIAYGNGITIRQLKQLNGLSSDSIKIGQKLKIPAVAEKKPAEKKPVAKKPVAKKPVEAPAPVVDEKNDEAVAAEAAPAEPAPAAEASVESAPAAEAPVTTEAAPAAEAPQAEAPQAEASKTEAAATTTYVVQEGDDMIGVAIRWGVTAADIRELNNLSEGDKLVPGQIIKLPADAQQ